jgi:hypothetical protein
MVGDLPIRVPVKDGVFGSLWRFYRVQGLAWVMGYQDALSCVAFACIYAYNHATCEVKAQAYQFLTSIPAALPCFSPPLQNDTGYVPRASHSCPELWAAIRRPISHTSYISKTAILSPDNPSTDNPSDTNKASMSPTSHQGYRCSDMASIIHFNEAVSMRWCGVYVAIVDKWVKRPTSNCVRRYILCTMQETSQLQDV